MFRAFTTMTQRPLVRRTVGAVLSVLVFTACQPHTSTAAQSATPVPQAAAEAAPGAPQAFARAGSLPDFAGLVAQQGPAVVNITTKVKRPKQSMGGLSPNDPFFEFFKRFGAPGAPNGRGGPPQQEDEGGVRPGGEGSGFVVSADGYILTNAHVVDGAEEVTVRMTDRREYTAKIVGVDKPTDVAVVKIDAKNLPVVRLGDPLKLRPGEWVVAIGSPFGFDNSVTAGIVSATARPLPGGDTNYVNFIQTDVAVNPGNSGGPLFNMNGEVVGINSQIYSRSGGYMGISFAIPIDVANNVREQLVAKGRVSRGKIGVSIQEVNAQFAESFGLDRPRGALVGSVEKGSPADKAGIKAGDIILSANGRVVERSAELPTIIGALRPGAEAVLEVWRERAVRKLTLKVAEVVADAQANEEGSETSAAPEAADKLGLVVRDITAEERGEAKLEGGVLILRATGAARDAGVQSGDVVLGVNGRSVKSMREFRDAVAKSGKTVALLVQREGVQIFVPIRVN